MLLILEEIAAITTTAIAMGVDARFVGCIRKVENGAAAYTDDDGVFHPSREFGVEDDNATTYALQLQECCRTVAHRLYLYGERNEPFVYDACGLRYSPGFITYFANIWAPTKGATNDPTGLNANWLPNMTRLYALTLGPNGLRALGG